MKLEPIDMLYELMNSSLTYVGATPITAEKKYKEGLLRYEMSSVVLSPEAALELAKEAYWYKQFYLGSELIAYGLSHNWPSDKIAFFRAKLAHAEDMIKKVQIVIPSPDVTRQ